MKQIVVLVVEDEPLILMDIADQLTDRGFEVIEAANADEAIAILADNAKIEILFTDVDMPGSMDGVKLAAAVRDRWPPVHIIVASGHRAVRAAEIPANSRFFVKPYSTDEIAMAMHEMAA